VAQVGEGGGGLTSIDHASPAIPPMDNGDRVEAATNRSQLLQYGDIRLSAAALAAALLPSRRDNKPPLDAVVLPPYGAPHDAAHAPSSSLSRWMQHALVSSHFYCGPTLIINRRKIDSE
jgi:hypothetical protein